MPVSGVSWLDPVKRCRTRSCSRRSSYGESGKAAARTLTKGWLVAVGGRLQHDTWEQDGQKRSKHLVVGHVEFLAAPRNGSAASDDEPDF